MSIFSVFTKEGRQKRIEQKEAKKKQDEIDKRKRFKKRLKESIEAGWTSDSQVSDWTPCDYCLDNPDITEDMVIIIEGMIKQTTGTLRILLNDTGNIVFNDIAVTDAIRGLKARGADIRVLVHNLDSQFGTNGPFALMLNELGLPVKKIDSGVKDSEFLISDMKRVWVKNIYSWKNKLGWEWGSCFSFNSTEKSKDLSQMFDHYHIYS